MHTSVGWFLLLVVSSTGAFIFARRLGRGTERRAWLGLVVALLLLGLWIYLQRRPAITVHALPVTLLAYLEGTASFPLFMFVMGSAWTLARKPRQHGVMIVGMVLGLLCFLNDGFWMIQTTPRNAFGRNASGGPVMQSQDYSCVPAACATALDQLGLPTTEEEMAQLTQTRPGTGATLIRALAGMRERLDGTSFSVELVQPDYAQLRSLPMPAITPLRYEATRLHMVVLRRFTDQGVWVDDPTSGPMLLTRQEFEPLYTGQVLVFDRER